MAKHGKSHSPSASAGHEASDASVRAVLIFAVALALLIVINLVGVLALLRYYQDRAEAADPVISPFVDQRQDPPGPRLEPSLGHEKLPQEDLQDLRNEEHAALISYGWVDREKGVARIPIDRAIDQAVNSGLPTTLPALGLPETPHAPETANQPLLEGVSP
jgi:hypothetical protein